MPASIATLLKSSPIPHLHIVFLAFFLFNLVISLLEVPTVRLLEAALCERYYRTAHNEPSLALRAQLPPDEAACKIAPVQTQLARMLGLRLGIDAIPGLLTAVWYGAVADRRGRRLVLLLAAAGTLLDTVWLAVTCRFNEIFPAEVALLSSLFQLLGGGERVFNSMVFTLVSDALVPKKRTRVLYLFSTGLHVARLATPPLAAVLMDVDILVPFYVSYAILGLCFVTALAVKEHHATAGRGDYQQIDSAESVPSSPLIDEQNEEEFSNVTTNIPPTPTEPSFKPLKRLVSIFHWTRSLFPTIASRICVLIFLFKRIAFKSEHFVFQYASERFDWRLSLTAWLRVASGSGAVFTCLLVCPLLTYLLVRSGYPSFRLDLNVVRICLGIVALSFFMLFSAKTEAALVIGMIGAGLGEGLEPALQGLIAYLTDSERYAPLFTTIAVVNTIADVSGGPLMGWMAAIGRQPGGLVYGYCFLLASVIFVGLEVLALCIRLPKSE